MKKLLFLLLSMAHLLHADVAHGVLEKYSNNQVYFGTGIRRCVNIARALNARFPEIYSMESDPDFIAHSDHVIPIFVKEKRRPFLKTLKVYQGDPPTELYEAIKSVQTPITFLLSNFIPDPDEPDKPNGILQELEQIRKHPIKTHTILIEYIQPIPLQEVKKKLLEINPAYKFDFETGGHLEKEERAILAAYIRRSPWAR